MDPINSMMSSLTNKFEATLNTVTAGIKILERRNAVKYKYDISGHKFQSFLLSSPTTCSQCKDLIYGLCGQSCISCRLVSHRNCMNRIGWSCPEAGNNRHHQIYNHKLQPKLFIQPTTCDHCGTFILFVGGLGVSCEICKLIVHNRCKDFVSTRPCEINHESSDQLLSISSQASPLDRIVWSKIKIEDFRPIRLLGRGLSGKVLLVELKDSERLRGRRCNSIISESDTSWGRKFALKIVKKTDVIASDPKSVLSEMKVLELGRSHLFLASLYCCFQTIERLCFVMEYVDGKDLFYYIFEDMNEPKFGEMRSKFYAAEVFLAIRYLHQNMIVHRDVKLENVILDKSGHCKLIDFGFSKELPVGEPKTKTHCGTSRSISPEIIKQNLYDFSVDWWAFGVMIYEMLLQESPFADNSLNDEEIYRRIEEDDPMENFPKIFSSDVRDLVSKLLAKDPKDRIGCQKDGSNAILSHNFFKFNGDYQWDAILTQQFKVPYIPKREKAACAASEECNSAGLNLTPIDPRETRRIPQEDFESFDFSSKSFEELVNNLSSE